MKRILIEPALFGDYYIGIYDGDDELLLDKKYFFPGIFSAMAAVQELKKKEQWLDLPVYIFEDDKELLLKP